MKKNIALLLVLLLSLALVACRNKTPDNGGNGEQNGGCTGNTHRDDNSNFVCDDCGIDLSNRVWFDHNGVQYFPLTDIE